jgi:aldehyde:ferredoxin oxidoreductase
MVLGDVASWHQLYLAAMLFHVGVDVDELACPLHCPMACNHQTRGHGFVSGTTVSCHAVVGGGAFLGDVKPLGLDI